jgi:cell division protein FtsQ
VAGRRVSTQGRPTRARAAAAASSETPSRAGLARLLPSRHSLLVGFGLVAIAGGAYAVARQTAMFSIAGVEVAGGSPKVRAEARHAAAPVVGSSLLALDGAALERRVEALPTVVSASYDRAFPHTVRLRIVPEVPVAVLRRGSERWLVSARGRVITRLTRTAKARFPRVWVPRATPVAAGDVLADEDGGAAARTLALAAGFPAHVVSVSLVRGELVFHLRSALELRLGKPTDLRLKLAIARRAIRLLPLGTAYLDISVPTRPVAGPDPQLSSGG